MNKNMENIINILRKIKIEYNKAIESKGERAEYCMAKSLNQIATKRTIHFEGGSYADVDLKIDFLVEFNEIGWIAIQVKYKGGINQTKPFENMNICIEGIPVSEIYEIFNKPKSIVIEFWNDSMLDTFYSNESMNEIIRDIKKGKEYFQLHDSYYVSDEQKEIDAKKQQEDAKNKIPKIMDFMTFKRGDKKENERRWEIAKQKYREAIKKYKEQHPDVIIEEDDI